MTIKTTPFNFAQNLKTDEDIRLYLQVFLEENGIQGLRRAIAYVAQTDIPGSHIAQYLQDKGDVGLESIDEVLHAIGLRLTLDQAA